LQKQCFPSIAIVFDGDDGEGKTKAEGASFFGFCFVVGLQRARPIYCTHFLQLLCF